MRVKSSDFGVWGFEVWPHARAFSSVPSSLGSEHPVTRWGFFQNTIIDYSWPGPGGEDGLVGLHKDCLVPSQSCKQSLRPAPRLDCSLHRLGKTKE